METVCKALIDNISPAFAFFRTFDVA